MPANSVYSLFRTVEEIVLREREAEVTFSRIYAFSPQGRVKIAHCNSKRLGPRRPEGRDSTGVEDEV